ncbi:acetolactate synthase [Sporosarcina sp. P16b]|uniref:thiamine pyrophosphate-dependent enzyme n=1 Tax=Sporosarcina sp. P16b TaxID=2048261 RepID=UPI000C16A48B|nr:thiamine pyrophosphate-dependent enzyme [Sporosarcina sp. P16b]PIC70782.1 acetolactate synthase [Sporosarcina sp. P16b]
MKLTDRKIAVDVLEDEDVNTVNLTGGQLIVDVLEKEGVTKIFGVPGESYLNVLDAIYEHQNIEYISTRQEGGASFMAEGYAKASGKVGVCMATRGPGATNLSIGIHTAHQDSTPLVALIGQVEREFRDREAFQEVDFVGFFSHLCKWTVEINHADRVPELLHRAFHIARSGRPGPVLVSLPEDMLDDIVTKITHQKFKSSTISPDYLAVNEAAKLIQEAERPIIIAGGGIVLSDATEMLVKLSELTQAPVASAFRRFHSFPNSHDNYVGSLGIGARPDLLKYIKDSDLVIALGTRFSQMTTSDYTLLNENSKLIHVDASEETLGKVYTPTLPIVSDIKRFLEEIVKVISENKDEKRKSNKEKIRNNYVEFSTPKLIKKENYVDMNSLVHHLSEQLPKDAIITSDAGNFFSWLSRYYRYDEGGKYYGPTSGAMGYGMPAAIGAKIAHPDKVVVSLSGDGGYMMTMQDFETAVRYNIPIVSIVINNNIFGTIRTHQERKFPNRMVGTQLSNPNYKEIAESFGGFGERVTNTDEFVPALKRALASNKPALIEVLTDPRILSANHDQTI